MADPLSLLRQFHINGREIKTYNGFIIFGDHGWPKTVNTNYQVYSSDDDKSKKEYYTLECLWNFLKNKDLAHPHYVKQAGTENIPVVHRPDRKKLLEYLKGEIQSSPSIDKNAPIPSLRLPISEIYKKTSEYPPSIHDPQPSSLQTNDHIQNEAGRSKDPNIRSSIKRPHDPEMEKKFREEFAARLYEPSNKKLATVIPTDSLDKKGETLEGSAAISKFGPEKLAAMRAKAMAVKRTTIIDADMDTKPGLGVVDPVNKEADMLIAMDSDPSRLIKSKEKIWRTRSSILQAHNKDFQKTIMPLLNLLTKMEDPNRRVSGPPSITASNEIQNNNSYQNPTQLQNTQAIQRNAYNRYDQERFVKLDIGVEIDTKKSFVSGASNGLSNYNQASQQPVPVRPGAQPGSQNTTNPASNNPYHNKSGDTLDGYQQNHHQQHHNHHHQRVHPSQHNNSTSRSASNNPHKAPKKQSTTPIIIIPATTTSLINMYNAATILQTLTYVEGDINKSRDNEVLIFRDKPDGTKVQYKIMDNPIKLDADEWNRVVAVFVQGPAWQFKGWPWGGSPVEIFSRIKAYHLKWDEAKLDDNVSKWNVDVLQLSRTKRHLDKAILLKFWSSLDTFMARSKSFLRF